MGERAIAGLLALDVLLLTGVLALTGGPFNPFSFLYLVHISLAAVLLATGRSTAWASSSQQSMGSMSFCASG